MRDSPISNPPDRIVYCMEWNQEPFRRDDRVAETIFYLNVQPCRIENPVDQIFEFFAADVVKLIRRDDFDVRQQECRIELGVGNASIHIATGHANLV